MHRFAHDFSQLLQTIHQPGHFHAFGRRVVVPPRLEVDGVGLLAWPILPYQARQLISVAEQAPYGRGEQTVLDLSVRTTWQIAPTQVNIGGSQWPETLSAIARECADALGVAGPVTAELHKLLIYETGGFFRAHRDTEKAPGMFGTLVVSLPSEFSGGALLVSHGGREVSLDLKVTEMTEVGYAAFYADCLHEVKPVTDGYRLVLIFNLLRPGNEALPHPPAYDRQTELATGLLQHWVAARQRQDEGWPAKLVYPLEHAYTPAEIAFPALKGADAGIAGVLTEAARRAECDFHLALVTIEETGCAEFTGDYHGRQRYRYHDDDEPETEFEAGELIERTLSLSDWCAPDGHRPPWAAMDFDDQELSPPDAFADDEPDEEEFYEATGNEGASFERSYRRAAFVLWPKTHRWTLLADAGLELALSALADLAAAGEGAAQDVRQLVAAIIAAWPESQGQRQSQGTHAKQLLRLLTDMGDRESLARLLREVFADGAYDGEETPAIIAAFALFSLEETAEQLAVLFAGNLPRHLPSCISLLHGAALHFPAPAPLAKLAAPLITALPVDGGPPPVYDWARPWEKLTPESLYQLLHALWRLAADSAAQQVLDRLLSNPVSYPFDPLLLPAALQGQTDADAAFQVWPPLLGLRDAVLAHLDARIAEPLAPPADYRRPNEVGCNCAYCQQLAHFLADPARPKWQLKAAETHRSHVEATIRHAGCDLNTQTLRHTRPYVLECTKNQASYQRRVEQRQRDLEDQARLRVGI